MLRATRTHPPCSSDKMPSFTIDLSRLPGDVLIGNRRHALVEVMAYTPFGEWASISPAHPALPSLRSMSDVVQSISIDEDVISIRFKMQVHVLGRPYIRSVKLRYAREYSLVDNFAVACQGSLKVAGPDGLMIDWGYFLYLVISISAVTVDSTCFEIEDEAEIMQILRHEETARNVTCMRHEDSKFHVHFAKPFELSQYGPGKVSRLELEYETDPRPSLKRARTVSSEAAAVNPACRAVTL